ncbi:uncharacterized protein BBOV_IV009670 [Babesia bovis T2Bo]|uniref:Ribosomal protein L1p/L10e family protein n=1 Tax=Babesia bovis TaxID=5865 RepID=A7AS02_BABBO|nr:uncharacterized protein BBOV_IV009670 [Babesia bovis T2Bo]EDO07321.1 hypothetical protein BBOV_IV009670 [Babesia bovis T2Bo]|eukprot:XP_001610889.1 hypothetical protein [Babesia bovis T2Bo]
MARPTLYRLNRVAKEVGVDKKTRKEISKASGKPASKPVSIIPKVGVSALDNEHITVTEESIKKAVSALKKRAEAERESRTLDLLEDPSRCYVHLQIFLHKVFPETHIKPLKIQLQYPIYRGKDICIFVKDPQKEWKKTLGDLKIREIQKVIGVEKLRKKYKEYKDRRLLVNSFDLFLSDQRVAPSLPTLLGKIFIEKKKMPISLTLGRGSMRDHIVSAINSTFYRVGIGKCSSVKVAVSSMSVDEVVANVQDCIEAIKRFHMTDATYKSKISGIYISWEGVDSLCLYSEELEAVEDIISTLSKTKEATAEE